MASPNRKIQDRSPETVMNLRKVSAPKNYYFPLDLPPHFIVFNFYEYNRDEPKLAKKEIRKESIALPIPQKIQEKIEAKYNGVELGIFGNELRNFVNATLDGNAISALENVTASQAADYASNIGKSILRRSLSTVLEGAGGQYDRATGTTPNPNLAIIFEGVDLRAHDFVWKFVPKTREESTMLSQIITLFKQNQLPKVDGFFLDYPNECHIFFAGTVENYLFPFKRCFLRNISIDYTGEGYPVFFEGIGAPASIEFSLSFVESSILTRDDISSNSKDS